MLTWEADEKDNYSVARYLWSLRDLPRSDEIQAMWILYVPRSVLAAAMIEEGRGTPLPQLMRLAFNKLPEVAKNAYLADEAAGKRMIDALLAELTFPVANLTHRADGSVYVSATCRKFNKMHPIHTLEGRWKTEKRLPLSRAYLQGGQVDSSLPPYYRPF
jgi:hypothetical protein